MHGPINENGPAHEIRTRKVRGHEKANGGETNYTSTNMWWGGAPWRHFSIGEENKERLNSQGPRNRKKKGERSGGGNKKKKRRARQRQGKTGEQTKKTRMAKGEKEK